MHWTIAPRRAAALAGIALAVIGCRSGSVPGPEATPEAAAPEPVVAVPTGGEAAPDAATPDVSPTAASFAAALTTHDYDALAALMVDPFSVGYWRSEGVTLSLDEARDLLVTSLLPADSVVATTTDPARFPDLDGMPVEGMFGPDVAIHQLLYGTGWGADGRGEALLYLVDVDGAVRWHGLIWAATGFEDGPDAAAGDAPDTATDPDAGERRTVVQGDGRGFSVVVPAGWTVVEFRGGLTLQSFAPEEPGRHGVPPDQTKIDIALIDPLPDTLEDALSTVRSGAAQPPSEELPFTLPDGSRGQMLRYPDATVAVVAVGGAFVTAAAFGDAGPLEGVVATLAPPVDVP